MARPVIRHNRTDHRIIIDNNCEDTAELLDVEDLLYKMAIAPINHDDRLVPIDRPCLQMLSFKISFLKFSAAVLIANRIMNTPSENSLRVVVAKITESRTDTTSWRSALSFNLTGERIGMNYGEPVAMNQRLHQIDQKNQAFESHIWFNFY